MVAKKNSAAPIPPSDVDDAAHLPLELLHGDPWWWWKQHRRELGWGIGLVALAVFVGWMFYSTHQEKLARSSDLFQQIQRDVSELRALEGRAGEEVAAERKSLEDRIAQGVLALSSSAAPYRELGRFYEAGISGASNAWESAPLNSAERLLGELEALARASRLVEDPASNGEARQQFERLAREGSFVAVSAATSLIHLATTGEERGAAQSLLASVVERFPEQRALVERELPR